MEKILQRIIRVSTQIKAHLRSKSAFTTADNHRGFPKRKEALKKNDNEIDKKSACAAEYHREKATTTMVRMTS